jgi:hypothetical protein
VWSRVGPPCRVFFICWPDVCKYPTSSPAMRMREVISRVLRSFRAEGQRLRERVPVHALHTKLEERMTCELVERWGD